MCSNSKECVQKPTFIERIKLSSSMNAWFLKTFTSQVSIPGNNSQHYHLIKFSTLSDYFSLNLSNTLCRMNWNENSRELAECKRSRDVCIWMNCFNNVKDMSWLKTEVRINIDTFINVVVFVGCSRKCGSKAIIKCSFTSSSMSMGSDDNYAYSQSSYSNSINISIWMFS